jgi:hypothetical protein
MHGQQNIKTRKEISVSYYYIATDDPGSKLDQNMLGGQIGKITFGRIKYKFRTSNNKNTSMYCTVRTVVYWYVGRVQTTRLM